MARYPEDVQLEALWQAPPSGEKNNIWKDEDDDDDEGDDDDG